VYFEFCLAVLLLAYRDKKVVSVFVRFRAPASVKRDKFFETNSKALIQLEM
jgi:hypothetical protein